MVVTACLLVCACAAIAQRSAASLAAAPLPEGAQRTLLAPRPEFAQSEAGFAGCTAPASGACGGCSISCPSGKAAYCASGLTDWSPLNGGRPPVCRQLAACYCS